MPECPQCEEWLSDDFVRVFSYEGTLTKCIHCGRVSGFEGPLGKLRGQRW